MNSIAEALSRSSKDSPFDRGRAAGLRSETVPKFPRADTPWEDRLFTRGWALGTDERIKLRTGRVAPTLAPSGTASAAILPHAL